MASAPLVAFPRNHVDAEPLRRQAIREGAATSLLLSLFVASALVAVAVSVALR